MPVPRIYVDDTLVQGQRLTLPEQAANHLARVLRLRENDGVTLFNGKDGLDHQAEISFVSKKEVQVLIGGHSEVEAAPKLIIDLAIGISKGERMDYAIQKTVELGVSSITPLITQRCVLRIDEDRMEGKWRHWQAVLISACEQSGRKLLPQLRPVLRLPEWLAGRSGQTIILDHRTSNKLSNIQTPSGKIDLLIGPEGGLSEQEKQQAQSTGCTPVRLGPRVMRTETAPVAAIAAIQALWGDFI